MDVNFYLFIVYQMYQYTVSDINRGTIFFKEVENSRPIFPCRATFVRKKSSNLHPGNFLWYKMKFIWSLARCLLGSSSLLSLISKLELQLFDLITINIQPLCAVNPRWTHPTITRRLAPLFIRVTLRSKLRSANYLHVKISCKKWMRI